MRFGQRFWRRRQIEIQLDAELRDHLDRQAHDLIAAGIPPDEARRQAQLRLGGLDQTKERCRDVGGARWLEVLLQDLRFALRQLRRSPGLTTVAIVTLALAIGANTAIFSLTEAALFPPFAASTPERLIGIYSSGPHGAGYASVSYPDFDYFRRPSRSLVGALAYVRADLRWAEAGAAQTLPPAVVTPNYSQLLPDRSQDPASGRDQRSADRGSGRRPEAAHDVGPAGAVSLSPARAAPSPQSGAAGAHRRRPGRVDRHARQRVGAP